MSNLRKKNESVTIQRIKKLLDAQNMKQQDLANRLNCQSSTVSLMLSGKRDITKETIVLLSNLFNVSTDYLLGLSDVSSKNPDVLMICEYTGLSESAVENLHSILPSKTNRDSLFYLKSLNLLLESTEGIHSFIHFLQLLFHCLVIENTILHSEEIKRETIEIIRTIEEKIDLYDKKTDGSFTDLCVKLHHIYFIKSFYNKKMNKLITEMNTEDIFEVNVDVTISKIREMRKEMERELEEINNEYLSLSFELEQRFPEIDVQKLIEDYLDNIVEKKSIESDLLEEITVREARYNEVREYINYIARTKKDIMEEEIMNELDDRVSHKDDSFENYLKYHMRGFLSV